MDGSCENLEKDQLNDTGSASAVLRSLFHWVKFHAFCCIWHSQNCEAVHTSVLHILARARTHTQIHGPQSAAVVSCSTFVCNSSSSPRSISHGLMLLFHKTSANYVYLKFDIFISPKVAALLSLVRYRIFILSYS